MVLADCFTSGRILFSRRAFHEKTETLAHSSQFLKFYFSSADSTCSGKCQVPLTSD